MSLPPVPGGLQALVSEMVEHRQLRVLPSAGDPAFVLAEGARTEDVQAAWTEIAPLYWGKRVPLRTAASLIRDWVDTFIGG